MALALGLATSLAIGLPPASAAAQPKPKLVGTYGDWQAFSLAQDKNKTCYIVSRPKTSQPKNLTRGEVFIMISERPADKVEHEFSAGLGYAIKHGAKVELSVGKTPFALTVFDKPGYEQTAWAADDKADQAISEAMAKGESLTVKGVSSHGTDTIDNYSLSGVTAALRAAGAACK